MNILLVSAHDDPHSLSGALQNAALSVLARQGHTVAQSNLRAEQFNPISSHLDFNVNSGAHAEYMFEQQRAVNTGTGFSPDIQAEMEKIKAADIVIFNFPLHWSAPPAIVSGWAERVLAMGFAWDTDKKYQTGLMKGKKALVVTSVGDPESYYSPEGIHRATVHQHLYPFLHSTLAFCGFDVFEPVILLNATASSQEDKDKDVLEYSKLLASLEQWDDYVYKHA